MNNLGSKLLPISAICCIYKNTILEEFILAIDSILVQDYIPNEVVIIVDGYVSNDIRSFLDFILSLGDIFKVFYIKENVGLGLALNYGIRKCANKLIARFDSDDINLKDRLKIQYEFIKRNPQISIVGSDVFEFNNKSKNLILKNMKNDLNILKYSLRNPLNHPTVLFRKKEIIKLGSYKNIKFFEDYELWLRCLKKGLNIHNINLPLVAMKRTSYFSNRHGFKYALCELNFLKETIKQKTIPRFLIPIYFFRICIRLVPIRFLDLSRIIDPLRNKYKNSYNLAIYIRKINENSNFKKFNFLN